MVFKGEFSGKIVAVKQVKEAGVMKVLGLLYLNDKNIVKTL